MSAAPVLDPRERFLREIVERIPLDRIAEIHLFPALRSGGLESAVAVIAAVADGPHGQVDPPVGSVADELGEGEVEPSPAGITGLPPDLESTQPNADHSHPSSAGDIDPAHLTRPNRLVVYRAVYRWTRKGPDRGGWEVDVTAEADAPLHAVSDVVRGVQRRAGEEGEPELITRDALRIALSDRPWATAM